jgi:hypothetical protein
MATFTVAQWVYTGGKKVLSFALACGSWYCLTPDKRKEQGWYHDTETHAVCGAVFTGGLW